MVRQTTRLRALLAKKSLLYLPAAYYPLGGRMAEALGFDAAYVGGYVTGGSRAVTEPLVTLTEQVETAESVARSIGIPTVCDAGAGFGEPLHVTRAVREFINAGVAGIHIEDQLYPKRAHYHKYVAHAVPVKEFIDNQGSSFGGFVDVDCIGVATNTVFLEPNFVIGPNSQGMGFVVPLPALEPLSLMLILL